MVVRSARAVLDDFNIKKALIDITFLTDRRMKKLNEKYMNRKSATDVLSFPLHARRGAVPREILGDVYISLDRAARNSVIYGTDFLKEVSLYVIHGVLHLLGFRDGAAFEKNKMKKLENKFLEKAWPRED